MAKLNLNFHEVTGLRRPTEQEIAQLQELGFSIEAIIKTLGAYAAKNNNRMGTDTATVCMCVCNALELLIEPIVEYLANYAGELPAEAEETA
jgi:DNA-binding transcriptional MerR regulator